MNSNGYNVTTEHINDVDVLCKAYKNGKLIAKFNVQDFGDWNEVEMKIDYYTQVLKENKYE